MIIGDKDIFHHKSYKQEEYWLNRDYFEVK